MAGLARLGTLPTTDLACRRPLRYRRRVIAAAILIGLAANADNLSVGIAYGLQRRSIDVLQNLLVAIATTAVTLAAFWLGRRLHQHLLASVPDWVGGMMLILLALAGLLQPDRQEAAARTTLRVGWIELALLAASLSVNNIGLALAGGFAGVGPLAALASVFGCSIVLLAAGQGIGRHAGGSLGGTLRQGWIGNIVLLLAGVLVLFGL